jgi:hypothetical protein
MRLGRKHVQRALPALLCGSSIFAVTAKQSDELGSDD